MLTIKKGSNTGNIYFTDSRNFGTIDITNKKDDLQRELDKLGDDLLQTPFTQKQFSDRVHTYLTRGTAKIIPERSNKEIIKVLMDQSITGGIGSGLGNYLATEICFHAKISPHKTIGTIYNDNALLNTLGKSIKYVTKLSYMTADTGYLEHIDPKIAKFITEYRKELKDDIHPDTKLKSGDKFTFKVYRQTTDPDGNPVQKDKIIAGRTTYWSPIIQK